MEINCRIFDSTFKTSPDIIIHCVLSIGLCFVWVFAQRGVSVCLCLRFALCLFISSVLGGGLFNILKQAFSNCYTYGIFIKILSAVSLWSQPSNMLITENIFISDGQVLMQTMYPKQNALMSLIVNYALTKPKDTNLDTQIRQQTQST